MGHTQDTPHMKISDLEDTITELQISCDGFAEQCSRLKAKIHNIEEGLRRLEIFLMDGMDRAISPINDDGVPMFALCASIEIIKFRAPTLADLIDAILIGGGTGEA